MAKFKIEPFPDNDDEPFLEPPEGWHKPCLYEDHKWGIELEDGKFSIVCLDPCEIEKFDLRNPTIPACHWEVYPEDFHTPKPIEVVLQYVDDTTPSTPAGPAEYGFYIEVHPTSVPLSRRLTADTGGQG